ncbi:MAG: 2-oxoglutarate dehydrogenase E1 component [Pseudomonadota bacterium]
MSALLELLRRTSAFSGGNAAFIEGLYEDFLQDPDSVAPAWRERFEDILGESANEAPDISHRPIRANFERLAREGRTRAPAGVAGLSPDAAEKQAAVLRIINAYRVRGHQNADLDPIHLRDIEPLEELDPAYHRLGPAELDKVFNTGSLYAPDRLTLREILEFVREVYTEHVGSEYMHITATEEKRWLQKRIEGYRAKPEVYDEDRRWLLRLLTAADGLEKYLHTRYVGQKRFSLEGGDALIPALDALIQRAGTKGVKEVVIGMAHRGRLNVLTNIVGKPPRELFDEFEGLTEAEGIMSSGDVKYHLGFYTDVDTPGGHVHVALGHNPSHLEIISPVVEGSVKARQVRRGDTAGDQVLPVLIHGDAALAGQGVVMETMQLSSARGFITGGTVHFVVNNQIGFTTSHPLDIRSTPYCTDVGKIIQAPVFHVNGDDPEAVIFATRLALDYRNRFHKDVIIDIVCYRRLGHNEADEPAVTQPMMYEKIRHHPPPRALYSDRLIADGIITPEEVREYVTEYREALEQGHVMARPMLCGLDNPYSVDWKPYKQDQWNDPVDTRVDIEVLEDLAQRQLQLPAGFSLHARVEKIFDNRMRMATGEQLLDWGFAENLAYATLLNDGWNVRLCGQDTGRGTFFHRHAVVHDQQTGNSHVPLTRFTDGKNWISVIDSLLSEEAVLGFEYGFASNDPETLVIWEAQFGDFANGAQVVIDQFIAGGGAKWGLYNGVTLFLPHGYEGQGAEHSSARLERFLQLSAEKNIQVCVPTTPAQIFHLLRRQMLRRLRIPLVVLTPKSLLRHKDATSTLKELSEGSFCTVMTETETLDPAQVDKVILCSGKLYYELLEARRSQERTDTAILRVEQLYPFPKKQLMQALKPYRHVSTLIWCQEEPQNQGAWDQVKHRLLEQLWPGARLYYIGRAVSPAPAVGYAKLHRLQQDTLVDDALAGNINPAMNTRIPA